MSDAPPRLPATIGRFRIDAVLGKGAMGVVYRAHDPVIERTVAIKLIHVELLDGAGRDRYLARFKNEARAAGRCQHPNIVGLHDLAMHEGNPYLVMEYVEGRDLGSAYDPRSQLSIALTGRIALSVLDALGYAHALNIVHRDIKPANILLTNLSNPAGPGLKVTDFGIARVIAAGATQSSVMVGTPSYMSPEQCRGDPVDQRCDLFSLGCVLHGMLGDVRTFHGQSYAETLYRLVHEPHQPLRELRPNIPAALAAVVDRALAKQPGDRFASAQEMAKALAAATEHPNADNDNPDDMATVVRPAGKPPPRPSAGTMEKTLDQMDPVTLSTLERRLAHYLGPIAAVQLRRAMREANSVDDLQEKLNALVPAGRRSDPNWQSALAMITRSSDTGNDIRAQEIRAGPATQASAAPYSAPVEWRAGLQEGTVKQITRTLAGFIGPIAGHLVSDALSRATTRQEFDKLCAAAIAGKPERDRFLAMLPGVR